MNVLPVLPPAIRSLHDPESERLRRIYPNLWADPRKSCLTCLTKKTFVGHDGDYVCPCVDQWVLHRFMLNSGIPLNYQRLAWHHLDSQIPVSVETAILEYVTEAQRYVNAGFGMVLSGTAGTGKTLLAVLLLKSLLAEGHDGYFTQFNTMLDAYTAGWRSRDDQDWFTRRVMNAGILVVDDAGKESKGRENVTNSMFDQVIRSRVSEDKPTIITTNWTPEEMRLGYGGGVMSLLAEKCFDHTVTGKDFRERAKGSLLAEITKRVVRPVTIR